MGMFGISGIPPLGNFWSKLIIILAAVKAGYLGVALLSVFVAVLTLGYFLKLLRNVYYNKPKTRKEKKEAPLGLLVPMATLSFTVLFTGVLLVPSIRKTVLDKTVGVMENFSYKSLHISETDESILLEE